MHLIYDGVDVYADGSHKLKLYDEGGALVFLAACRNASVASNAWAPANADGISPAGCPPGNYLLGKPELNDPSQPSTEDNNWIGEGEIFIPVYGIPGHDGIGIHGGGTCVTFNSDQDALKPVQGWCPTENCFRLQNVDLKRLAGLIPSGGSSFQVIQAGA